MALKGKSGGGPAIGIDIGTSLIKLAEARPGRNGIQITALGIAPTPPGCISNEIVIDPQTLGKAIQSLMKESGISCKKSVSSVSGQSSVIVRIIELPRMTKQELPEAMKWEIERHVPFSANEIVMDFQPLDRPGADPGDQNMEILLAVAQEAVINSHIEALTAAGIVPNAIDVQPLASARSIIDISPNGAKEGTVAIINIGATSTELGVYRDGYLAFPRTLPIAGNAITQALSDKLGISFDEAERIKREKATVLLDRLDLLGGSGDMDDMSGGFGQGSGGTDMNQPDEQEFPFLPGLGYGPGYGSATEEEKPAAPAADVMPDFDIDIGGPASAPKPVMDFDLHDDHDTSASAPVFDLGSSADHHDTADISGGFSGPPAAVNYSDEKIFEAIAPVLGDLLAEIRRSLDYYTSRYQDHPGKVFLCGGTAKLNNIDRLLQLELGVPCSVANPMHNVTVMTKTLSHDYLEEISAMFPVSIGLAIRDLIGE